MGPPNRKWQVLGVIGALALAVVVCLTVPGPGKRPEKLSLKPKEKPKPEQSSPPAHLGLPFELKDGKASFGNRQAAVKVIVFIPGHGGCGNESAVLLHRIAQANKDKLYLEVVDFESDPGAAYQEELGSSCAGLMINGKQIIRYTDDSGKKVTLDFTSNLGDKFGEKELYQALDREFQKAYGEKCQRPSDKPEEQAAPEQKPQSPKETTAKE